MSTPDILKIIGDNMKALRKSRELSQELLALVANMDRSYIGAVERGDGSLN